MQECDLAGEIGGDSGRSVTYPACDIRLGFDSGWSLHILASRYGVRRIDIVSGMYLYSGSVAFDSYDSIRFYTITMCGWTSTQAINADVRGQYTTHCRHPEGGSCSGACDSAVQSSARNEQSPGLRTSSNLCIWDVGSCRYHVTRDESVDCGMSRDPTSQQCQDSDSSLIEMIAIAARRDRESHS